MKKEIYEALKARISVASEEAVEAYYKKYPDISREATVYKFDLSGLDEDYPSIIHAMHTKNIWNVAQRFHWWLQILHHADDDLLVDRHVSCK